MIEDKSKIGVLCRKFIENYDEYTKVDFKSTLDLSSSENKAELCKLICAIGNSNSPKYDNIGYIILGAKRGELIGGINELAKDSTSASIRQIVASFLDYPVKFEILAFKDEVKGLWGAIEIFDDPQNRPLKFKRSVGTLGIKKDDAFIRDGDSIRLANPREIEEITSRKFTLRVPSLNIAFFDGKDYTKFLLVEPEVVKIIEKKMPETPLLKPSPMIERFSGLSETVNRINAVCAIIPRPLWVGKSQSEYEAEMGEYRELMRQLPILTLVLRNDGTARARDIDVTISFPREIEIMLEDDIPDEPSKPGRSLLLKPSYTPLPDFLGISPTLEELDEEKLLSFYVKTLKHTNKAECRFAITNETPEGNYSIKYEVHCEEDIKPTKGELKLIVKKKIREEIKWISDGGIHLSK
ncbi:MAG: ATP-binding protein [Candidatus Altiarchaeota archaeon]